MSTFLENQNWRYATKKFDATKKITDADIGEVQTFGELVQLVDRLSGAEVRTIS